MTLSPQTKNRNAREILGLSNRVDEVVQRLRSEIVTGRLAPGDSLPSEGEIATTLRVSRTVIREAMRILCTQGLVEISQGRRPRVKAADSKAAMVSLDAMLSRGRDSLRHLTEVRLPLEIEISGLAAERATAEQLAALESANQKLSQAKDLEAAINADIGFHQALAMATNNPLFVLLLETVAQLSRESRRRTLTTSGVSFAHLEHVRIYECVKKKDPIAARAAMREHMQLIERDLALAEKLR